MWRRGLVAEKQTGDLTNTSEPSNVAREVSAAVIKSAKFGEIPVGSKIAVTTENATGALPEIGNDHNISFIISGAGFDPCLPLAHIVGCSHV